MSSFLFESSLSLLAMLLIDRVFLAKTTKHQFKRAFLLACLLVPLVLPFISFNVYYEAGASNAVEKISSPLIDWDSIEPATINEAINTQIARSTESMTATPEQEFKVDWYLTGTLAYGFVALFFLLRLSRSLWLLRQNIVQSTMDSYQGHPLVLLETNVSLTVFSITSSSAKLTLKTQRSVQPC